MRKPRRTRRSAAPTRTGENGKNPVPTLFSSDLPCASQAEVTEMLTLNCWQALRCGKEHECPAYPNHGRTCIAVTGTLCRGEKQGSYLEKVDSCRALCSFYREIVDDVYKNA
jgi:methyl-accepting chemotaxis protein